MRLAEDAEDFVLAHDDVLDTVELDLGAGVLAEQSTRSPAFTSSVRTLPSSVDRDPTAITFPSCGFSLAVSGG